MHRDDSRNSAVSKGSGFFGGIKQKMVLIFCLISILVLIAANLTGLYGLPFGNYGGRVAVHRAEAFRLLNQVADTKKADLLNWIDERKDDLRQAAGERWVRNSAAQLHDLLQNAVAADGKITDVRAALMVHDSYHFLMEHIAYIKSSHMPIYEAIRIADAGTGVIMCSTVEKEVGGNISEHAAFQAYAGALSSATTYVADIFLSKQDAVPSINFSDVVRWPKNEAVAVIQMRVNADKAFDPILHSGGGLGAKGEALLVNRQQFVLTSLRFPMADGTRANPLRDRISAEPARLAAGGNEGNIEIEDYRGVPVLAAYRYIRIAPDWGWGMVVKLDRSEIMSPLKQDIVSSIWIGLLGVVAVVILTLVVAGRIVRPIAKLTNAATRLAGGDRSVRSHLDRRDEIGVLAAAFDSMADTIETSWHELESHSEQIRQSRDALATRRQVQDGVLAVSNALASAASLESVLKDGLNQLMSATHSQVGAAYLRDDHLENSFRLGLALGFAPGAELPTLIAPGEEAAGLAAQRRQTVLLNELPSDTRFTFTTIAGKALPAFILNTPLIFNDQVIGVIALAGLYPLTPQRIEMVEMSRNQLAISITNALAHARTKRLAEELQVGNEELRVANEELQVQGEELRTQADRLRQQSKELEKRRKEAEVADRLKSQFLSNVSHELRTPLHSILSLSQLLIDREAGTGSPEMLESLRVIERNGRNLLNMINDVLDLAKIESGAMEIHLSEVDPHQVALKALETIRPLAAEKGLELIVDLAEVPPLYSDEERLYQILLNLLSNAVKFTEKGKVGLHVSGAEDRVAFAVSDTGIGIASNDLAKIFKEFHQIDGAPTRRYEGTGLGLAIAEKLAGMLGGEIIVDSTVGEGSTFTFALPLRWQCEIEIRPPLPSKKPTQSYSGRRQACHILVVEDNETAALQIQSTLKEEGYAVTVALGGIFAMECLQRFVPDGIILDLMMPEIDGFELLEYIRSTPAIADVPVLVLTAMDVAGTERALLHAQNVQKLIQKGAVDRGQLLDAVRRMLQG